MKVKEINYFDMVPHLSIKDKVLKEDTLNYHMIKAGMYFDATISKVNTDKKFITLNVNEFVQGNLHLENMGDNPLKVMPPKLTEVGKQIRVRVLYVDISKRYVEFTKKDSFMKESAPVYESYRQVRKGDKLVCTVVSHAEHGLVIKSFGNIKGLITYEDIKQKEKQTTFDASQYKVGTVLKAYCLFKKADKGIALTLSKKKAAKDGEDGAKSGKHETIETHYLPNEEEMESILNEAKYNTLIKPSQDSSLVG